MELGDHFLDLALAVLCHVHGGVGGVEKSVLGDGIFRVEGDADTGGGMENGALDRVGLIEGSFEAEGNLLNLGAASDDWD
jgi:hypothetical protein